MKNKVKFLSYVLAFTLIFVLAGCDWFKKEPPVVEDPEDFSVLGNWQADTNNVYTLTTNTATELTFDYEKATYPDASITKAVDKDLSVYKKLVIVVQGTGSMKLSLQNADGTAAKEVSLNVTGIEGTYEWNLKDDSAFLKNVKKVVITGAPGKEESVGTVTVKGLTFKAVVAAGFIINTGYNNIPNNVNEYNGTDETFNFNAKWENANNDNIYTVTAEGDVTKVEFEKTAGKEWACMNALVKGDFSKFNFAVVILKNTGTTELDVIVKVQEKFEERDTIAAGEEKAVVVDFSAMTAEQKNAIPSVIIFGLPGAAAGTGKFEILQGFMINDYEHEEPVEEFVNEYDLMSEEFSVTHWYDNGDNTYEITENGTDTVLTYNKKAGQEWSLARVNILEGDAQYFQKLVIEVTGIANKSAMFKVEGAGENIEKNIMFDGTRQTVEFDLTTISPAALAKINKVMVFAGAGAAPASGSLTIHSVTFKFDVVDFTQGWVDNGDNAYTFTTQEDGSVKVDYTKTAAQSWSAMKYTFTGDVSKYNTMMMILSGTAGKKVLVKPNDNGALQTEVTFDETGMALVTAKADLFTNVIIFAEPGDAGVSGSFTINVAILGYEAPVDDPNVDVDVNNLWVSNDLNVYTFATADGIVTVNYTKVAQAWSFMKAQFEGDLSSHNAIQLVIKGENGKQLLVKPNDSYEQWITLNGEEQTFTFLVKDGDAPRNILIFAEPGTDNATGTFDILSAKVVYVPTFKEGWVDNGDAVYTFTTQTDGTVKVDYTKVAGQSWSAMKYTFEEDVTKYNTLVMQFKGEAGKGLLVKPNNAGNLEKTVTFDNATDTYTITVTADQFTDVIIFASQGTESISGSFTIVKAYLTYVKPAPVAQDAVVDVNKDWTFGDTDVYTLTPATAGFKVDYTKAAGREWSFMKSTFEGDLRNLNTLRLTVKGEAGKQMLVKLNNATETYVTFDGTEQTIDFTFAGAPINVLLFVEPNTANVSGSFDLISAKVLYVAPQA